MRVTNVSDPVYAPNSYGGPTADPAAHRRRRHWYSDGEMVRTAYTLRAEDDDWGQAGTLVREVLDDAARDRLVDNVVGHLLNGVSEPVLARAFEYWRNVDKNLGDRVEAGVRAKAGRDGPEGRRAGQPGPVEHAGQGLTERLIVGADRRSRPAFTAWAGAPGPERPVKYASNRTTGADRGVNDAPVRVNHSCRRRFGGIGAGSE